MSGQRPVKLCRHESATLTLATAETRSARKVINVLRQGLPLTGQCPFFVTFYYKPVVPTGHITSSFTLFEHLGSETRSIFSSRERYANSRDSWPNCQRQGLIASETLAFMGTKRDASTSQRNLASRYLHYRLSSKLSRTFGATSNYSHQPCPV